MTAKSGMNTGWKIGKRKISQLSIPFSKNVPDIRYPFSLKADSHGFQGFIPKIILQYLLTFMDAKTYESIAQLGIDHSFPPFLY